MSYLSFIMIAAFLTLGTVIAAPADRQRRESSYGSRDVQNRATRSPSFGSREPQLRAPSRYDHSRSRRTTNKSSRARKLHQDRL